jgi:hypothetical protein
MIRVERDLSGAGLVIELRFAEPSGQIDHNGCK